MSGTKTEIETYFGRCRCCLSYGYLKNMWSEHQHKGVSEVYGEMLIQCFALSWNHTESSMEEDQICEQCVVHLRDATNFKKLVLDSQEEIMQQIDADVTIKVENDTKYEVPVYNNSDVEDDTADPTYTAEYGDTGDESDPGDDSNSADYGDSADYGNTADDSQHMKYEMEYEEVEYLEEDDAGDEGFKKVDTDYLPPPLTQSRPVRRSRRPKQPKEETDDGAPKRKWPKKLPKSERFKTYRQYTEEAMRRCLEEVKKGAMTPLEASKKYNVPKKTICAKLKTEPKEDRPIDYCREKTYILVKEIKEILTYTNATPFKSKNIRFHCAYCSSDGPTFDDPDELRTHTRTVHLSDRIEKIEYAMRPCWLNEVLKLDIYNLVCTVCCQGIGNWNEMFTHLKSTHNVFLDLAYTKVIPFVLTQPDLKCALCKKGFSNFMHLDGHMNAHYNNYVCDDCGDTFLAQNRLKQHAKIHNIGKFPCHYCNKVYTLQKYRRKHEELVHKQLNRYKCAYCPEKFVNEYVRHLHCLEMHNEKIKPITCEVCGKVFTWRQYYTTHMRKKHEKNKRYACDQCPRKFFHPYELKDHSFRHTGEKNFECPICNKKYVSLMSLKLHGKQHKNFTMTIVTGTDAVIKALNEDSNVSS